MLAALATLAFLATIWLVGSVAAQMLSESGGKILAALRGESKLATIPDLRPIAVRVSQRSRQQRTVRAQPQWRAAA